MDSIKQVAVLMKKKNIVDGISIYFPDHIISGFIDEEDNEDEKIKLFTDDYNHEYLLVDEPTGAFSNDDVVWYNIPESTLLKKYEGLSREEALVEYFNSINKILIVGLYDCVNRKVLLFDLDFDKLYTYINDQPTPYETLLDKKTLISKLFDIDMNDEFVGNQSKIYKKQQTTEYVEDASIKATLENVNSVYEKILKIDDIDKLKKICADLEEMYMNIAENLDSNYKFSTNKVKDEIENFVYKTIDIYHSMGNSNDINEIKGTIASIRDRQKNHFMAMIREEDSKQRKREERQQELEDVFLQEEKEQKNDVLFNPGEMKEFLDKRVIGQEEAKRDIISAIFMNSLADESISKNTCLLVGPTGSGKTLIAESVAGFLDLPFVNIDTTQLTVPGYVGANIEDFLGRLIESANGDVEKAENGIVILDEIDKKGSKSNGDVSGKGVLNTLLPFVQGTTYIVSYNRRKVNFNTKNLTIFMTGAFTDVAKGVSEESLYNDSKIGFGTSQESQNKEDIAYKKLDIEDFVEYGNFPIELIGRISNVVQLSGHTMESLRAILIDSDISVLKLEAEKLKKINVEVKYSDDYLDAVAEKALKLKTGARSLKSTIENSIKEARWEAITSDEFKSIILNKDCVEDNLKAVLVYNDGNYTTVEDLRNKKEEKTVEKVKK